MTPSRPYRLFLMLVLLFRMASSAAGTTYWLPEVQKLNPGSTRPLAIQLEGSGDHSRVAAWQTLWTVQPATERWNDEAARMISKYRVNPLRSVRMLAMLHVGMHDAGLRTEQLGLNEPAQSAATHAAASKILAHFFPLEPPGRFEAMGGSALAALIATQPKPMRTLSQGASIGQGVARLVVLRGLNDGADEVWDARMRPAKKWGVWRGAPPLDTAHPQEPLAGTWQTWVIKNGGEFRPPAPPSVDSDVFRRAAQEVLEVRRSLTAEQKRVAEYWHLDQGTVTPPGLWNQKARELAARRGLSEKARLRLLSMLNVAMMDASIACWHAKYSWWVQRPITTIHEHLDNTFTPYLVTPPHPSYTSGHATVSGAAAEILKQQFPQDARQIDAWAVQAAMSRLYGGIHYRFDNDAGLALGREIGKTVLARVVESAGD